MKPFFPFFAALLSIHTSWSFVQQPAFSTLSRNVAFQTLAAVALEPEPDGGEELNPEKSMPGSRMKKMAQVENVKSDDGAVYSFWMTAEVEGALIKEIRSQILKDAAKKANFPGFRKGQVPPYAQPQITGFSVQEAIIKTVEAAVNSFGLKSIPGSAGEINVNEDVEAISKGYKVGDNINFTARFNAVFDAEKQNLDDETKEEKVIDVRVASEE